MEQMGAARAQCVTLGSDQATINRLADIADTCSVDLLVPEAFSCAVCLKLMVCPIKCFPCRHSFCEPCVRLITHASAPLDTLCPICRQPILCCGPNNALKNQILHIDPLMASAYERRLDWFCRQEAFHEMRLPGIAGLGILPKIGACLPGGNRLADYLVRTLFGLITGRGARDICSKLLLRYQQLFAVTFSVLMFLLVPCIYLRTILQHPLPPFILSQTTNESAYLDALFNTSDTFNSSKNDGNGTATALPFTPFGRLGGEIPFFGVSPILLLVFVRFLACARLPGDLVDEWASCSRGCIRFIVICYLSAFPFLVCLCWLIDIFMMAFLFDSFCYWNAENRFARLRFAVCSFACAAYWVAVLLATAACFKLDTSRHIGSWKCFRVLIIAFFLFYVAMWLVLIALDCYYNFVYH